MNHRRPRPLSPAALTILALACPVAGCDECVPGETRCEGDTIMVCVEDDAFDDDDTCEDGDEGCDLLCYILDSIDEATDNRWREWKVCGHPGTTCVERTDSSGGPVATCGYAHENP